MVLDLYIVWISCRGTMAYCFTFHASTRDAFCSDWSNPDSDNRDHICIKAGKEMTCVAKDYVIRFHQT